ncbi:MAG: heavy metal translocating P-type ATPase [Pseudomonadota bacterium]
MTAACPACAAAPTASDIEVPAATVALSVPKMRCAACIGDIERALRKLPDVMDARVNFTLKRVNVETHLPPEKLVQALSKAGFDAYPLDLDALGADTDPVGRDLILRVGVAGFAMMNVMLLSVAVWSGATDATRDMFHLISAAIALPAALFSAQPFFRSAAGALRGRRLNMDVPISLAIILAGGMSLFEALNSGEHAYFDAALSLTFFLLIGRVLEHRTRASARSAARELSALEVQHALKKTSNGVEKIAATALAVGDRILVPAGVRVPADGLLVSDTGFTDRSFLTGESDPVQHRAGAELRAGEINIGAPIELTTLRVGEDTKLRQMARLVETAENLRNSYTSLADRAAQIYAPVVHILAAATFAGWFIATGDARHALNIAIAVLIITCPCALGLAVPAVSTAAVGRLYRLGFLVKSGTALERLAEIKTVVLDKTGTLTRPGFDFELDTLDDDAKSVAKGLSEASSHPVSLALNQYLTGVSPAAIASLDERAGQGVSGLWNRKAVALERATDGTVGLVLRIGERNIPLPYRETELPGAATLAAKLQAAGLDVHILSGDTAAKTERLANRLGVTTWSAGVTPEGKHQVIRDLAKAGATPVMVGDGINDTVALTAAHASVAPGSALDAARNAADVVLTGDTLDHLPALFQTARTAVRMCRQNFGIAIAYNAVAIPIAVAGFATPIAAALAMSTSSICVLVNAMRVR